jgi:ribose 5-phosphate isomerase A
VWSFIDVLAESGIQVSAAVAASVESARRLREIGIQVIDLSEAVPAFYVDGADEIDMSGRAIKGGGGAHTSEKAIAMVCDYWACIVDATKVVRSLGSAPIPVEVAEGTADSVMAAVEQLGGRARIRAGMLTDAGNVVVDAFGLQLDDPVATEIALDAIPGALGNGVFARRPADVILVGRAGGGATRITPHQAEDASA